jgi:CheY-like chemotaxis protein
MGRTLLLADDSATIQKVVDLTFTDEGLKVITVGDGQQAVEKLEEIVPDIVLADVFMPGLNGYQVCEHIKRNERFRHIPVMLLVGSFEPFDEAEARRVGADDYLTKPFQSIRALVGKVRDLMSGGGASSNEAVTRKLAMPPETDRENSLDEEALKRATADTAPLPEHEQEETGRRGGSREGAFADLSMDDQMIEATPADNYGSASDSAPDSQAARPTAAYSTADLKEAGISQAVEGADAPGQGAPAQSAYAPAQAGESSHGVAGGQMSAAGRVAASDDALLDLGDIEPPPHAMAEADDFFLDLLDEPPGQRQASAPFSVGTPGPSAEAAPNASATAEAMDASARADYEAETAETAPPQAQEFAGAGAFGGGPRAEPAPVEEAAPPVAEYQPAEQWSPPAHEDFSADARLAPTERLPGDFQVEGAPAETGGAELGAAPGASPAAGQITLDQLSPEVIDAIARRAVEQLSERVVEQIAWEVVPELAELLIKRRLEKQ